MGDSWRIGVDEQENTTLVRTGLFNGCATIYTAMMAFGLGLLLESATRQLCSLPRFSRCMSASKNPTCCDAQCRLPRPLASVGRFVPGVGLIRSPGHLTVDLIEPDSALTYLDGARQSPRATTRPRGTPFGAAKCRTLELAKRIKPLTKICSQCRISANGRMFVLWAGRASVVLLLMFHACQAKNAIFDGRNP